LENGEEMRRSETIILICATTISILTQPLKAQNKSDRFFIVTCVDGSTTQSVSLESARDGCQKHRGVASAPRTDVPAKITPQKGGLRQKLNKPKM
jgi:hypothetical protein